MESGLQIQKHTGEAEAEEEGFLLHNKETTASKEADGGGTNRFVL